MIFAWNDLDPDTENGLMKHEHRGVKSVILLDDSNIGGRDQISSTETMDFFDITVDEVKFITFSTLLSVTYHIITPIIDLDVEG